MEKSISSFVRNWLLVVSCSVLLVVAVFSFYSEILRFTEANTKLKEELLQERNEHIKHQVDVSIAGIKYLRGDVKKELDNSIKSRVDEAYNVLTHIYTTFKSSKSDTEIKKIMKASLREHRFFNGRGYYFIYRKDGLQILVPTMPSYESVNMLFSNYNKGSYPIFDIIKGLESRDTSYVSYKWQKSQENGSRLYDKRSYVRSLPFYDWIIGAGDYLEDLEKEIQEKAIFNILNSKYDKFGYVFVNTIKGEAVVTGLDNYKRGDDLSNLKDPNGLALINEELKLIKNPEGGYFNYKWKNKETQELKDYVAYVKYYPQWEWIIGVASDIESLEILLQQNKDALYNDLYKRIAFILLLLISIIVFVILISRFIKKRIEGVYDSFYVELKESIKSKRKIGTDKFTFKENVNLSNSINVFLEKQYILDDEVKINQQLLQTLIDSIPLSIFYKDTKGIYVGCNDEYCRFLGVHKKDIIGKSLYEIFSKEQADIFKQADNILFKSGGIQIYDTIMTNSQGELRNVNFHKVIYKDNNELAAGMLGVMIDITSRIQNENKLKESEEKLIKLNDTKDRFFSIIAHDLKNPFNSLIGLLNILIEDYDEIDDRTKKEYLKILNNSSNDLYSLLTNLLDWSRTQTSGISFSPVVINIRELIAEQIRCIETQAFKKNISVIFEFREQLIATVDKEMISTVVRNLISNAIKFTPIGGQIEVIVKLKENTFLIIIKDNGLGISPDNLKKLFIISERIISVGTANEGGTGLGLILCKEFIDKHKGKIYAESEEGNGSTFFVELSK